jgi:hypothetical protein
MTVMNTPFEYTAALGPKGRFACKEPTRCVFNCAEFDIIKSQAGLNRFRLSAKEWSEKTHAVGIISKAGRYGGTYAHKDIAFEFAMWISPEFKVYLIREFQRLKDAEQKQIGWTPRAARKPRTPGTTWSNKHSYAQYHSGTELFRMLRPRIFTSNPVYP